MVKIRTPPLFNPSQSFRRTPPCSASGTCQMLSHAVMKSYRPRQLPAADVGLMDSHVGMPLSGQRDHSLGNVHAFDIESLRPQKLDEASVASASHVERVMPGLHELHGPLMLRQSGQGMLRRLPLLRDG